MPTSTLTSKGQITIPKSVRDKLRLRAGDRLDVMTDNRGNLLMRPKNLDFRMLKGRVKSPHKKPISIREMDEIVARAVANSCED
jgi:AbrB family looped-hinge helix DNA binding protein